MGPRGQKHRVDSKVAVVVVNWNGWRDTIECLESLQLQEYGPFQVIVVDNASSDGSVEHILKWARGGIFVVAQHATGPGPKPVAVTVLRKAELSDGTGKWVERVSPIRLWQRDHLLLICNEENLGFSGGNNIGIRIALEIGADYVLLLNNDTVVAPTLLKHLVGALESFPTVGAACARIHYYDRPDIIWYAGGAIDRWRLWPKHWGVNQRARGGLSGCKGVSFVNGAALMVRSEVLQDVGWLDEAYFVRMEDVDYSWRLRANGWKAVVCLDALVWHKVGRSAGREDSPLIWYYDTRNRVYFARKHLSPLRKVAFIAWMLATRALNIPRLALTGRGRHLRASILGMVDGLSSRMGKAKAKLE